MGTHQQCNKSINIESGIQHWAVLVSAGAEHHVAALASAGKLCWAALELGSAGQRCCKAQMHWPQSSGRHQWHQLSRFFNIPFTQ